MLDSFELFSVDKDVWASIRNVQQDYRDHLAAEIREVVSIFDDVPFDQVEELLIIQCGELIRLPGSDLTHFVYDGMPLLAWTLPKMVFVGESSVHITYMVGTLDPASEETQRVIAETI